MLVPNAPFVSLDRLIAQRGAETDFLGPARMSQLGSRDRVFLLGEPGSGKSTAFRQAAKDADVEVVTARQFVEGARPAGRVVFIDALEEYRIGEQGRERLSDLVLALEKAPYAQWRIACRSISLSPADLRFAESRLGASELWQLLPLDQGQILEILRHAGESDPVGFVVRIRAMAAGPLLGNPATLLLLRRTLATSHTPIRTRSALLDTATYQMAHELNEDHPERADRPEPSRIIAAAEAASLVLILSGRSDIWALDKAPPPEASVVSFDDLIPAGVSTLALRFALDTPMFRGEAGAFQPTHRMVAEFLGGRALADATDPSDPQQAALPIERALSFLSGDDDRPAPALTGVYAWFVCALAKTRHAARALDLVRRDPESVLVYGDPAMLPTAHRLALLETVGRDDPWAVSRMHGSTAVGGLAGEDLADAFRAILRDPDAGDARKILVFEALANGPEVDRLKPTILDLVRDAASPTWIRERAFDVLFDRLDRPDPREMALLRDIEAEADGGPAQLRLHLLRGLVGHGATPEQVRAVIVDYARSEGPTGHLRRLGAVLTAHPMPALFDLAGQVTLDHRQREGEARRVLQDALAAAIDCTPALSADRLLGWLHTLGLRRLVELEAPLQQAVARWLDEDTARPQALFDVLLAHAKNDDVWSVARDYRLYAGRGVPDAIRDTAVAQLETLERDANLATLRRAAEIAARLSMPGDAFPALKARVNAVLTRRPDDFVDILQWLNFVPDLRPERHADAVSQRRRRRLEAMRSEDRQWMAAHLELVRSGGHRDVLVFAAAQLIDADGGLDDGAVGADRLTVWWGAEGAQAIHEGWERLLTAFPMSAKDQGKEAAASLVSVLNSAAAFQVERKIERGDPIELSPLAALGVFRSHYQIEAVAPRDRVAKVAVDRLLEDAAGRQVLLDYWLASIRAATPDFPDLHAFLDRPSAVGPILSTLLRKRPILREQVLQTAIEAALTCIDRATLASLTQAALKRDLPDYAQRLWTFIAFMLVPADHPEVFETTFKDEHAQKVFAKLYHSGLENRLQAFADVMLIADPIVIRALGPLHPPRSGTRAGRRASGIDDAAAAAIGRLSNSPLRDAGAVLAALQADPALAPWRPMLTSRIAEQAALRRTAEFKAPPPKAVAKALRLGPPATPADLRAVIREVLAELAIEIRDGDTSPWRGFWNRPYRGKRSPKDENDCRDLITDRLRDRLAPFKIPARRLITEGRSRNDRRVDLIVLGEGAAAVPIEAKRHYNKELWTAPQDQLSDYAQSLKTSGHGIYLVFWFGSTYPTPPRPGANITTPRALEAALKADLPLDLRDKVDVVIVDVAHQETVTEKKARLAKAKSALGKKAKPKTKPGT